MNRGLYLRIKFSTSIHASIVEVCGLSGVNQTGILADLLALAIW